MNYIYNATHPYWSQTTSIFSVNFKEKTWIPLKKFVMNYIAQSPEKAALMTITTIVSLNIFYGLTQIFNSFEDLELEKNKFEDPEIEKKSEKLKSKNKQKKNQTKNHSKNFSQTEQVLKKLKEVEKTTTTFEKIHPPIPQQGNQDPIQTINPPEENFADKSPANSLDQLQIKEETDESKIDEEIDILHKDYTKPYSSKLDEIQKFKLAVNKGKYVKYLHFPSHIINKDNFITLFNSCPNLEALNFYRSGICSSLILALPFLPKSLKKLSLMFSKTTLEAFKTIILPPKLESFTLHLYGDTLCENILPLQFYQNLPPMTSLSFGSVNLINSDFSKLFQSLKSLNFYDSNNSSGKFQEMENLENLKINMANLSEKQVTLPTHLQTLHFEKVALEETTFVNISELNELKSLTLESTLFDESNPTEKTTHSLLRPSLEQLYLYKRPELTTLNLTNHLYLKTLMIWKCDNLESLDFPENLEKLTIQIPEDIDVDDLLKKLPMKNLNKIWINSKTKEDNEKIENFFAHYPQISWEWVSQPYGNE